MNQELHFSIAVLQNTAWKEQGQCWRRCEALGFFETLWVADHFVNYGAPNEPWFEAWTLLAAMATQTKTIRIGTLVSSAPWRNPAFLARQALTVDHLSGGRLELGLGAGAPGYIDPSYKMTGIPDWPPAERAARFREIVAIVDQLLRERVSSYTGKYYQLQDTTLYPAPLQQPRPPLTIGAEGPKMLKVAAQYADRWNTFGGTATTADEILAATREKNARLNDYCAELGRDPATLRRSFLVFGAAAELCYSGSLEAFYELIGRYQEAGIQEFVLFYPFMDRLIPAFERIVGEGIPKLRGERVNPLTKLKNYGRLLRMGRQQLHEPDGIPILPDTPRFKGAFTSLDELEPQSGLCVVLRLTDKTHQRYRVLDVVEAEDIHAVMLNHERATRWQEHIGGEVYFAVHYVPAAERAELAAKILQKFSAPCYPRPDSTT